MSRTAKVFGVLAYLLCVATFVAVVYLWTETGLARAGYGSGTGEAAFSIERPKHGEQNAVSQAARTLRTLTDEYDSGGAEVIMDRCGVNLNEVAARLNSLPVEEALESICPECAFRGKYTSEGRLYLCEARINWVFGGSPPTFDPRIAELFLIPAADNYVVCRWQPSDGHGCMDIRYIRIPAPPDTSSTQPEEQSDRVL